MILLIKKKDYEESWTSKSTIRMTINGILKYDQNKL